MEPHPNFILERGHQIICNYLRSCHLENKKYMKTTHLQKFEINLFQL